MKKAVELLKEGLLTVREAEQFSGWKKSSLYRFMERGDLPYVKIGAARRIPKRALIEFLAKNLVMRQET